MNQPKSDQEKRDIVSKVEALKQQGMTIPQAAKAAGTTYGSFYTYKKQLKLQSKKLARKSARKPKLLEIPVAPTIQMTSAKVFVLFGEPVHVAEVVRSLQ